MDIKSADITALFEQSFTKNEVAEFAEIGKVVQVGDAHCTAYGLNRAVYGELVDFEGGNKGIIFDLDDDSVTIFLLYAHIPVAELEVVKRTGTVFKSPTGNGLLGRIISAIGKPIDGLGDLQVSEYRPIEIAIPGIIERTPIHQSLETGILAIDALIPIGKGQRELVIGNRSTGKTSIVLDTILHQKGKDVICIYVAIGQRQANLARFAHTLRMFGALEYTVIISADASEPALDKYLAPYVGCTAAEYFKDQGKDVLIIYDDLSNHAIAYREMSLLMRRSPGREAYPGDVFYLHSRLLERAGKFKSGGSITALPIAEVQSDDITAYIPTNLISITDGQIFLDTKLFNNGIRPAINIELSVSRVGGAAQTAAMRKMVRALRLELAQYHELLAFSQFGSELDAVSQERLARGARIVELLKQHEHASLSFVDQVIMLFLLKYNFLDAIKVSQIREFCIQFVGYIKLSYSELYKKITESGDVSDEVIKELSVYAKEFSLVYIPVTLL
ncbi:MAG: F0F1 ATP synthase subunit alpha [Candidatus Babeliaceae bacterium]|nr:F0F1 ATP synthase subunit alpha [Candidatus Babeliaceae bacterium]